LAVTVRRALGGLICLGLVACGSPSVRLAVQAPPTLPDEPPGYERAVVTAVIDGDTIEVLVTGRARGPGAGRAAVGRTYDVRLLGVDTPESVDPNAPVECFGPEASAAADALLAGAEIKLVRDVEEEDRYGRLLRFVYVSDEMVNARLVANGYARAYPYPPNLRHAALFESLQQWAKSRDLGLWADAACGGRP
jgi:micrococcal nuclease